MKNFIFLKSKYIGLWFLLAIIILALFQVTILNPFSIFNVKPDLFIVGVVIIGLSFKLRTALTLNIFAGVLKDSLSTGYPVNTLMFAIWTLLIARLIKEITIDYDFMRIVLVCIVTLFHNIIIGLTLIYSGNFVPAGIFLRIVIIEAIYTTLVSIPLLRLTNQFNR